MALDTTDVAEALNGVTLPAVAPGSENDLQQVKGASNIKNNGDGTFTAAAGDDTGNLYSGFGAITFKYIGTQTVSGSNLTNSGYFGSATSVSVPVVTFQFDGQTFSSYVLAFTPTQVLLVAVLAPTTAGAPYTQGANRFLVTTGGPDSRTSALTLSTTGASYTPPVGATISCFVSGTRIATPDGFALVEDLTEGDLVTTLSGDAEPVTWAGRRTIRVSAQPRPELVRPVTIRAGAFGDGLPSRDLTVSADHNLFTDGVLIPAKCLLNGRNVVLADLETVTYHHIELAAHDVVFAEGLPTETYLEVGNRTSFEGGAVVDAHPDFATTPDTSYFAWEARGFAPLVLAGAQVEAVRARLAAHADQVAAPSRRAA